MLLLYYPPHRADSEEELLEQAVVALEDYFDDLKDFDRPVLESAWREVRRAHRGQGWPTIAAIRDACLDIRPEPASGGLSDLPQWYQRIARRIGATQTRSWFGKAQLRISGREATITFPSKFTAQWSETNYRHIALEAVQEWDPEVSELHFAVRESVEV